MSASLPVFNWSLSKLLATETGAFNRARLKILFTVLVFSILKTLIVIGFAFNYEQHFQLGRSLLAMTFYVALLKLFLINKENVKAITHTMIWAGIILVWSNIFISAQTVNIITLQFIFMIFLSSFYLLNRFVALVYSLVSVTPVIAYLLLFHEGNMPLDISPENFVNDGAQIIVILNFCTIILTHYLYHQAFNITLAEKENLNHQLKLAVKEANRHAQSKTDFLSTMSHELRTPLNAVIGLADILLEDAHAEQKENLETLSFSAHNLHALINDILDFNKLESGKIQLESISVNIDHLLRNTCAGLRTQATEKGLDLILDIDPALKSQFMITDPTRITQIIYNLVGNGIKFTSRGSVTVAAKVLEKSADNMYIHFEVRDTGIGIHPEKHQAVFEAFVQASTSTTRTYGGTGLGLSIVKRLLSLYNSDIHLESSPGKGSTFSFDMKFKTTKQPVTYISNIPGGKYDLSGLKVLLAEDNPVNVYVVKKLCQKWNVNLTSVENGRQVLEELKSNTYDVVLMDIHMPEMDGYEASMAIRSLKDNLNSGVPIIALTASVSSDVHIKISEAGMNDYVCKPFNSKELYNRLKNIRPVASFNLSKEAEL